MSKFSYKLVIEYDGTDYAGWQVQPNVKTIQGDLEIALSQLFQEQLSVTAAGRTDAGVHAAEQVVNFTATKSRKFHAIKDALNSLTSDSISILSVQLVDDNFNARFDARRRYYQYRITRVKSALQSRFAWCMEDDLDLPGMQQCARAILGQHDFKSFCSSQAEVNHYLCTVYEANWRYIKPELLIFLISANRFLHNMVRILVGTMIEVGKGRFTFDDFFNMLKHKDRKTAGVTAPAKGLCLLKIDYDNHDYGG